MGGDLDNFLSLRTLEAAPEFSGTALIDRPNVAMAPNGILRESRKTTRTYGWKAAVARLKFMN